MGKFDCSSRFVRLINDIGYAGANEISMIDSLNLRDDFKYYIRLTSQSGEGKAYNYKDYTLNIEADDRHLTLKTVASYDEKERRYLTKIFIIYKLSNDKNYIFELQTYDINGWNYENLINFDKKQFYEEVEPFKNNSFSLKDTVQYFKKAFTAPELDKFIEELEANIKDSIERYKKDNNVVEETLNSLTTDQSNILKKRMKYGK